MQGLQDELAQILQQRITNDPYTRNYSLTVTLVDGPDTATVVLDGRVRSFYAKQMAQVAILNEIEAQCNGTSHLFTLENHIEVER